MRPKASQTRWVRCIRRIPDRRLPPRIVPLGSAVPRRRCPRPRRSTRAAALVDDSDGRLPQTGAETNLIANRGDAVRRRTKRPIDYAEAETMTDERSEASGLTKLAMDLAFLCGMLVQASGKLRSDEVHTIDRGAFLKALQIILNLPQAAARTSKELAPFTDEAHRIAFRLQELAQFLPYEWLPLALGGAELPSPELLETRFKELELLRRTILAAAQTPRFEVPECSHAEDFTWVIWYGDHFAFSLGNQAETVRHLWESWEQGGRRDGCGLKQETLKSKVHEDGSTHGYRVDHVFREHPALHRMICKIPGRKGIWALYKRLPDSVTGESR